MKKNGKIIKPATMDGITEAVRDRMMDIAHQNNGVLTPNAVLDDARDATSPLNPLFEWDDTAAGESFRLIQSAGLIRRVRITVIRSERKGRTVEVRAVRQFEVPIRGGGYRTIESVMQDDRQRESLLEQALRDFEALRRRYEQLTELAPVFSAIVKVKARRT